MPSQSGALRPARPGLGAPASAGRRPSFGEALDQLGRDVQQLRVDFERFFNGALPFPPDELRGRVQAQLRNLRNSNLSAAVDSFRLGDLEARYNSYNELFNRRLRDLEEGRHAAVRHAPPPAPSRHDPAQGIVFGERIDPEAAEALYHGLAAAPGDSVRFDLDSFQTYLARQVAAIREKTGCSQVQFRLASEDGKLKLKARPVAPREGF
ncbi:MAG TPA: MXAN_5187 C-terminal domain-containing protein [Thermoanaerobaculia bacterium]|nr:MXAN_5187 C-terminal domain-containing protein [Thermoanaerobaculia bacterium]